MRQIAKPVNTKTQFTNISTSDAKFQADVIEYLRIFVIDAHVSCDGVGAMVLLCTAARERVPRATEGVTQHHHHARQQARRAQQNGLRPAA